MQNGNQTNYPSEDGEKKLSVLEQEYKEEEENHPEQEISPEVQFDPETKKLNDRVSRHSHSNQPPSTHLQNQQKMNSHPVEEKLTFEWKGHVRSNRSVMKDKYFMRTEGYCRDEALQRLIKEIVKDIEKRSGLKRTPEQKLVFILLLALGILILFGFMFGSIAIKNSTVSVIVTVFGYLIGIPLIICAFCYRHNMKPYGPKSSLEKVNAFMEKNKDDYISRVNKQQWSMQWKFRDENIMKRNVKGGKYEVYYSTGSLWFLPGTHHRNGDLNQEEQRPMQAQSQMSVVSGYQGQVSHQQMSNQNQPVYMAQASHLSNQAPVVYQMQHVPVVYAQPQPQNQVGYAHQYQQQNSGIHHQNSFPRQMNHQGYQPQSSQLMYQNPQSSQLVYQNPQSSQLIYQNPQGLYQQPMMYQTQQIPQVPVYPVNQ